MNKVLLGAALTVAGVATFAMPAHANTHYDWFHCGTPEAESDCPTTTTYAVPTTVVTIPTTVTTEPTPTTEDTVPVPTNLNPCISEPQLCPTTTLVPSTLPVSTPTTITLSPTSTTQPLSNVPTTQPYATVSPVSSVVPSPPTTIPNNDLPQTGGNYDGITLLGIVLFLGGTGLIIAEKRHA